MALSACVPEFDLRTRKKGKGGSDTVTKIAATETEPGVVVGTVDAEATTSQQLDASESGAIAGTSAVFPPGALAVDTDVTLQEGQTLATPEQLTDLGIGSDSVVGSSPAVLISSSEPVDAAVPFTVNLAIPPEAALTLRAATTVAVLYRAIDQSAGGAIVAGLIIDGLVSEDGTKVAISTKRFGIFQVVRLSTPPPVVTERPAVGPVLSKKQETTVAAGSAKIALSCEPFPTAPPGAVAQSICTVNNAGSGPASNLVVLAPAPPFAIASSNCESTLPGIKQCTVTVAFSPSLTGEFPLTLKATYDTPVGRQSTEVKLVATSVGAASLSVPASVSPAGPVAYGDEEIVPITITNQGATAVNEMYISISGPGWSEGAYDCISIVEPGTSCTYNVKFEPLGEDTYQGTVTIVWNDGVQNHSSDVDLTGVGVAGLVTVAPRYGNVSNLWNDYVKRTGMHADCDGTELGAAQRYSTCAHAGAAKLVATNETACAGLELSESLEAFQWHCEIGTGGLVRFVSTGLRDGKGLRDLVLANAWKPNLVTIAKSGVTLYRSVAGSWWEDVVAPAPNASSGMTTLPAAQIYTIATSTAIDGYQFGVDKAALVTLGTATISGNAPGYTCEIDSPNDTSCLVFALDRKFIWIEASVTGNGGAKNGVLLNGTKMSVVTRTKISNVRTGGTGYGLYLKTSDANLLSEVLVGDATDYGVKLNTSDNNVLSRITLFNNDGGGLSLFDSSSNTATQIVAMHSGGASIINTDSFDNVLAFVTSANASAGFRFESTGGDVFLSSAVFFNNSTGIYAPGTITDMSFRNIAAANSTTGIDLSGSGNGVSVTGFLTMGGNSATCSVGTSSTGLVDGTCASSATFTDSRPQASSFVGINATDTVNANGATGTGVYNVLTDWKTFENPFRGWGVANTLIDNSSNRGTCSGSNTCSIYDFSLTGIDTTLRNVSGDGVNPNGAFTPGGACPTAVRGDHSVDATAAGQGKFLDSAIEIFGDGVGNDDGLCNAGEVCVYAPNIGAYQGHGAGVGPCTYDSFSTDLLGITIVAHQHNGY